MEAMREFIEIEDLNGEIKKAEIIGTFKTDDSDKEYALLTTDDIIGDEVNIDIGFLYEKNGQTYFELVEDEDELSRLYSLIDKMGMES